MEKVNNNRIVKNTFVLYFRLFFTLAISLYVTRRLLQVLGVEDFGLLNIVGGVVMMFSFLNNAMIAASQRFITYSLASDILSRQKKVFSTSIIIHLLIAIVIVIALETVGLWYINNKLNVSESRLDAAFFVFHSSIITFFLSIINVPFSATVIAHERMSVYGFFSIFSSLMKLAIVVYLPYIAYDNLIIYSVLLVFIELINFIFYSVYCVTHFAECRITYPDMSILSKMLSFAGWSFLGNFGVVAKDYGVNLIINSFCNTAVNASRGIAYQVMNAVNGFVAGFQTAMNPQITKRYAIREIEDMLSLVFNGAKYSFYLLSLFVIPLFIRAEYVLGLWLGDVPEFSVQFLRLALVMSLINSMAGPFVTSIQATGNIKIFQIVISIIMTMDMPLSYVVLRMGCLPYAVVYISIITAFIGFIARVILLRHQINFNVRGFIVNIVLKNYLIVVIIYVLVYYISRLFANTFVGLLLFCFSSVLISLTCIYIFALNLSERRHLSNYVKRFIYA